MELLKPALFFAFPSLKAEPKLPSPLASHHSAVALKALHRSEDSTESQGFLQRPGSPYSHPDRSFLQPRNASSSSESEREITSSLSGSAGSSSVMEMVPKSKVG